MSFKIIFADILTLSVDAVVNTTDQYYSGGGGLDRKIHSICGESLYNVLARLPRLHLGEAEITGSFGLKSKYIIHTSAPSWRGEGFLEISLLGSCYRNSIALAHALGLKSIAFPLIASKRKHFPKEIAFTVAVDAIKEKEEEYPDLDIYLVLYAGRESVKDELVTLVNEAVKNQYIPDSDYIEEFPLIEDETRLEEPSISEIVKELIKSPTQTNLDKIPVDESFGEMLKRLMKEKGITNTSIQDETGLSGPGLWKILNGKSNPSKMTVFALAVALQLPLDDTKEILMKAGYAVNTSSLEDVILSSLIENGIYDRYTIDDLLYSLDLTLLPGAQVD